MRFVEIGNGQSRKNSLVAGDNAKEKSRSFSIRKRYVVFFIVFFVLCLLRKVFREVLRKLKEIESFKQK